MVPGKGGKAAKSWDIFLPCLHPNLPQGFLTWNIITSVPYGLIYILLQVKLIQLRNKLKIPQSILGTVQTLVISGSFV